MKSFWKTILYSSTLLGFVTVGVSTAQADSVAVQIDSKQAATKPGEVWKVQSHLILSIPFILYLAYDLLDFYINLF